MGDCGLHYFNRHLGISAMTLISLLLHCSLVHISVKAQRRSYKTCGYETLLTSVTEQPKLSTQRKGTKRPLANHKHVHSTKACT